MEDKIAKLVKIIRDNTQTIKEIEAEYAPLIESAQALIKEAKANLEPLIKEHGNWKDDQGHARWTKPSTRTGWNTKGLNKLMEDSPHLGWLEEYRKETPVKGSLRVE